MREVVTLSLVFLYFLLSGYTLVEGETGRGILGRITLSDLVGLALIILALVTSRRYFVPRQYMLYLPFLFFALASLLASGHVAQGTIEFLVHAFIWCVSLALLNLTINAGAHMTEKIFSAFLAASFLLAAAGLLQYLVFPSLFSGRITGGLVGTFRNSGQSGSFFGLALSVIVAAFLAGLIRKNPVNLVMAGTILVAFLLTFKRAAYVGFGTGLFFLLLMLLVVGNRKDKFRAAVVMGTIAVAVPLVAVLFEWGVENIKYFEWRMRSKLSEGALEKFQEGFLQDNLQATFAAWSDHPMLGTGWGNIIGKYTEKYELHSTYMAVLAQTGIIGTVCYLLFMSNMVWQTMHAAGRHCKEALFALYFSPFLFGLIISWAYTYHLRKREFWIAFMLLVFCCMVSEAKLRTMTMSGSWCGKRRITTGEPASADWRPDPVPGSFRGRSNPQAF